MLPNDVGEDYSEPWTHRKRIIPLRTYCGKVNYKRKKHYFKPSDTLRITKKLEPQEDEDAFSYVSSLKKLLREITEMLMEKLLPFLGDEDISNLYDVIISFLDRFFRIDASNEKLAYYAKKLIMDLASRFGLTLTIK